MTRNAVQGIPDISWKNSINRQKAFHNVIFFIIDNRQKAFFFLCYELNVDKSASLEIHFGQLNLLELFLFKNQKDLCQNNRCQEEQKALDT